LNNKRKKGGEVDELPDNDTRQRILDAADELFSKRGYAAVTLRDIATAVKMRQPSLYYYAPGGKEQLFMQVMERNYTRHRQGLEHSVSSTQPNLYERLLAMAHWLLSQPPVDYTRVMFSDVHSLKPEDADRLMTFANSSLIEPIEAVIKEAMHNGELAVEDSDTAAHMFLALVEALHAIPEHKTPTTRLETAKQVIELMLYGWLKR
jgi:AcrR family transcriptional regulator